MRAEKAVTLTYMQNLAWLSAPRVVVDTSGLTSRATELANLFAEHNATFTENEIESLLDFLKLKIQPKKTYQIIPSIGLETHKINLERSASFARSSTRART